MNTNALNLASCTILLAAGALGQESNGPWTARMELGGNIPESPSLNLYGGPVTGGEKLELDAGVQFTTALGYKVQPWLKLEAELGISYNEIGRVGDWWYRNSSMNQFSMMVNLVVERPVGRFVPYAGIGAGGVVSTLSFGEYNEYYCSDADGEATEFVPAVQALAGVCYHITENASLGVAYRFLALPEQKWKVHWWDGYDFKFGVDSMAMHSICASFTVNF